MINKFIRKDLIRIFNYLYLLFSYLHYSKKTFFLISETQSYIIKRHCNIWGANYILGNKKLIKGVISNVDQTLRRSKAKFQFVNLYKLIGHEVTILLSPTNFYQFILEEVKPQIYIESLFFFTPVYLIVRKSKIPYPTPRLYLIKVEVESYTTPILIKHISFFGEFILYFVIIYLSKLKVKLFGKEIRTVVEPPFSSLLFFHINDNNSRFNNNNSRFNNNNSRFNNNNSRFNNNNNSRFNNNNNSRFNNNNNSRFNNNNSRFNNNNLMFNRYFLTNFSEGKLITTWPRVKPKNYFYKHQWTIANTGKLRSYAGLGGKRYPRRAKNILFIRANFQQLLIRFFAFRNRRLFFKYFVCRQRQPIYRFSSRINYYLVNIELQLSNILIRIFWAPNIKCVKQLIMKGYIAVDDNIIINPFFIVPISSYITFHLINNCFSPLYQYKPVFLSYFSIFHRATLKFYYKYVYRSWLIRRHKFFLYYTRQGRVYKLIRRKLMQYQKLKTLHYKYIFTN